MKVTNLTTLKKNINQSTIFIVAIIFSVVLIGLFFTHHKFIQKRTVIENNEVNSAANIFKSNLSEKLSIVASSTIFLDYLRSGDKSRTWLYPQFLSQLSTLKTRSIAGMQIKDMQGKNIFNYGKSTPIFINLNLCYLSQTLDADMGACQFTWTLYFRENELIADILSANSGIKICQHCKYYDILSGTKFGSFSIHNTSTFKIPLGISSENDYFFYIYLFLIIISLVLFSMWSWRRLNNLLNDYIANPIQILTQRLKSNNPLNQSNFIDEIEFLINEIDSWKEQLNKVQADANAAKLAKIAAQLAHDVRSPLAAIDMMIKGLENIPDNYRLTLRSATQRISDIANNFLSQYRSPQDNLFETNNIYAAYLPEILESIIAEKRSQYIQSEVTINLFIQPNAWNIFASVNPTDFKRIMSNLINNSVEAISKNGFVNIILMRDNDYLQIDISDNGKGISADLLLSGGISIGKKNGSGLGLSHAMEKINAWHGQLSISSTIDIGTTVQIKLPFATQTPTWFQSQLNIQRYSRFYILDDDINIYHLWQTRLNSVDHLTHLNYFSKLNECNEFLTNYTSDTLLLIDYDLGQNAKTGLDIIEEFRLNSSAILVTNRYDDKNIQDRCITLGIKIIPKMYILHIPFC